MSVEGSVGQENSGKRDCHVEVTCVSVTRTVEVTSKENGKDFKILSEGVNFEAKVLTRAATNVLNQFRTNVV